MNKSWLFSLLLFCVFAPAKAYWQQEVKYNINVELEDSRHLLHGNETVVYINNSPDTLREMFFHLWPNAYQSGTPLAKQILEDGNTTLYFGEEKYKGKLDSIDFKVNNQAVALKKHPLKKEVAWFDLPAPLIPGDSIIISTPFRVKVPYGEVSRLGHLDDSYQINQWYPKPAVYDQKGWHVMPYLSVGEFYSEFGSFEVSITIPNDYDLAASGNRLSRQVNKDKRTEVYSLNKVHDFAWFTDKNWITEESSVTLPHSGRTVKTYIKYQEHPSSSSVWSNSVQFVDSAVYYYSLWVGDYPYDVCGAVDGGLTAGSGMEYPTITVLGGSENRAFHEEVTVHEVGHNWFYGILGSNERLYPWMDEGLNSYYERRYYEEVKPEMTFNNFMPFLKKIIKGDPPKHTEFHHYLHDYVNTRNIDLPLNLPAPEYSSLNYGSIIYSKSAVCFNYLQKYLGTEVFDAAMKDYFQTWKFKHPQPEDFEAIIKKHSDKNLDWFFNDLMTTSYPLDYKINNAGYSWDNTKFEVVITNKGDIASPVVVSALKNGKVINTAWYEGFFGTKMLSFPKDDYDEVVIDYYHDMPEINRRNNRFILFSVFGNIEPLEASFLHNYFRDDRTQVFFTPLMGYNQHDNLQLGVAATNLSIQESPFRFLLMPQFSFGTNRIVGTGQLVYSIYPGDYFDKVNINFNYKRQGLDFGVAPGQIAKTEAGLNFMIHNPNDRSKFKSNIEARFTNTEVSFDRRKAQFNDYVTFDYNVVHHKTINPYDANLRLQAFNQNWKLTSEFNYDLTVNKRLQSIDIRLFGGAFLQRTNDMLTQSFSINGNNGTLLASSDLEAFQYITHDYLFDDVMYGRFVTDRKSLARQQVYIQDGGFKSGMGSVRSKTWIGSVNLVIPLPVKFLSLYSDFGITDAYWEDYQEGDVKTPIIYDYGFQLNIKKDFFEIYFPLGYSDIINQDYENGSDGLGDNPATPDNEFNYFRRIKFMFNMNKLYKVLQ